ncbi:MAG: YdbL family protein [Candidatus Aminicenantes bacterium]|nr:YdbL family protein [Candidatus Aminicenantes bacterium]
MKTRHLGFGAAAAAIALVLACITVNIYFPEATVKQAADEIVEEIRKRDAKDQTAAETVREEARSVLRSTGFRFVPAAFAQEETTVSNPAIRALKESMKQRFPNLKPFYDSGNVGETNDGRVEIRDEGGLDLKTKAALRGMVKDENSDRTKLYAEVAKALNIEAGQIDRIRKIFAESWQRDASPGWWIQKESGEWVKKPA